ncbi:hypothetical protein ACHHYP_09219, partial [Achlya hypogyna]
MRGVARWLQQEAASVPTGDDVEAIESDSDDDEFIDGKKKRKTEPTSKRRGKKEDEKGQMRMSYFVKPPGSAPPVDAPQGARTDSESLDNVEVVEVITLDDSVECASGPTPSRAAKRKPLTYTDASSSEDTARPKRRPAREAVVLDETPKKTTKKVKKSTSDDMEIWTADTTPPKKRKAAAPAFFLTAQQKEQIKLQEALVREQEALLKFQSDMEKRKALDMAFYAGKTAVNPFFQKVNPTAKAPIVIDGDIPAPTIVKWAKAAPPFPPGHLWHVNRLPPADVSALPPFPVGPRAPVTTVLDLARDKPPAWATFARQNAVVRLAEAVDDDALWVHSVATVAPPSVSSAQLGRWAHALRSRRPDAHLLSADRFAPVSFNGVVGSKESVVALYEWLRAWKLLRGGQRPARSAFYEFFTDPDSDASDDDDGELFRLLVLQGEAGAGKTCSVYACAAELGYQVLEINAGQLRSGKALLELAGEATQSTRVAATALPVAASRRPIVDMSRVLDEDFACDIRAKKAAKQPNKAKKKKKKVREDFTAHAASLSVVLLEDVDVLFDADKGFLNALSQMAKQTKCPIIATCTELPDNFPTTPPYLLRQFRRPTASEFQAYLQLMNTHEQWTLPPAAFGRLHRLCRGDLRRALHFLDFFRPGLRDQPWATVVYRPLCTAADATFQALGEVADRGDDVVDLTEGRPLVAAAFSTSGVDVLHATYLQAWTPHYCVDAPPAPLSWADNDRPSALQCDQMEAVAALADAVATTDLWLR